MKMNFVIKAIIGVLAVGLLAGGGGTVLNLLPANHGEPHNIADGKLAADDLNDEGEQGWQGIPEVQEHKGKPRRSTMTDTQASMVCYALVPVGEPPVLEEQPVGSPFVLAQAATGRHVAAFHRKASPGDVKGGSKLLVQDIAVYESPDAAKTALSELQLFLSNPTCTRREMTTFDPPADAPVERKWDIEVLAAPDDLGGESNGSNAPTNAVHFRARNAIAPQSADALGPTPPDGSDPELIPGEVAPVEVWNDIVVVRRGKTLLIMMETSPGDHPTAEAEAKNHAGKADNKMKNQGGGGA